RAFVVDWAGSAARASVSVLDTATGTLLRSVPIGVNPRAVALDRRAGRVFVLNDGAYPAPGHGTISVLDALAGQVLRTDTIDAYPRTMATDARTGRMVLVSASGVSVLDSRTGAIVRRTPLAVAGDATALAMDSRLGRAFTIGRAPRHGFHSAIDIFDTRTGRL